MKFLLGIRRSFLAARIFGLAWAVFSVDACGGSYIAGYQPWSQVTDQNAFDLDQAQMVEQLSLATNSYEAAFRIYTEGAHTKMVAEIMLMDPLPINIAKGTQIFGVAESGQQVAGYAFEDHAAGSISMIVGYQTSDFQKNYVNCQVGANVSPNLDGCFKEGGTITIESDREIAYSYDPRKNNVAKRTIQGLSLNAREDMYECATCPHRMYEAFYDYYGEFDYANQIVLAAFEGRSTNFRNFNIDFGLYGYEGREQIIKTATVSMNFWMYVIHKMEEALENCMEALTIENCEDNCIHAWDEAVAFYTGSLEGEDGSGSGKLFYAEADKRCANFKTCGDLADSAYGGSKVNIDIFRHFHNGLGKLSKGECASAREDKEAIEKLMLIPLIQSTLKQAWKMDMEVFNREKNEAKGVAAALAVVPAVWWCDEDAGNFIAEHMVAGGSNFTEFFAVKAAFEATYECLGIDPALVGGYYDPATGEYIFLPAEASATEKAAPRLNSDVSISVSTIVLIVVIPSIFLLAVFVFLYLKKRKSSAEKDASSPANNAAIKNHEEMEELPKKGSDTDQSSLNNDVANC